MTTFDWDIIETMVENYKKTSEYIKDLIEVIPEEKYWTELTRGDIILVQGKLYFFIDCESREPSSIFNLKMHQVNLIEISLCNQKDLAKIEPLSRCFAIFVTDYSKATRFSIYVNSRLEKTNDQLR